MVANTALRDLFFKELQLSTDVVDLFDSRVKKHDRLVKAWNSAQCAHASVFTPLEKLAAAAD